MYVLIEANIAYINMTNECLVSISFKPWAYSLYRKTLQMNKNIGIILFIRHLNIAQ